jgi:Transglutaminase-like superfamily
MNALLPEQRELSALLRLLDDDTPEVRSVVVARLMEFGGDISEVLPGTVADLTEAEEKLLTEILLLARRQALRDEWLTPSFGSAAFGDDWELFESHLRLLSDYLHDGLTLRQPLSDALDSLAEEAQERGVQSADHLRVYLFEKQGFAPNAAGYYDPRNADLAWCIDYSHSNPIGLGVIYMLVGQRLGFEIQGVCFPGHFLCRIQENGYPFIVDCYDMGRSHRLDTLTATPSELSGDQRRALQDCADLGTILLRILNNLIDAFQRKNQVEDAALMTELRDSMIQSRGAFS